MRWKMRAASLLAITAILINTVYAQKITDNSWGDAKMDNAVDGGDLNADKDTASPDSPTLGQTGPVDGISKDNNIAATGLGSLFAGGDDRDAAFMHDEKFGQNGYLVGGGEDELVTRKDKKRLGAAKNVNFGTWRYVKGKRDDESVLFGKRRIGSARNVKHGTWKYKVGKKSHDLEKRPRGLVSNVHLGTFEDPGETHVHGDTEKRRIGAAKNVRYGTWNYKTGKRDEESRDKRRIGAAKNVNYRTWKYKTGKRAEQTVDFGGDMDKRRLGAAKNVNYGTWFYKTGKRDDVDFAKRRLGSARNVKYGTWRYETGKRGNQEFDEPDKRRLGSARNVKFGTWRYKTGKRDEIAHVPQRHGYDANTDQQTSALGLALYDDDYYRLPYFERANANDPDGAYGFLYGDEYPQREVFGPGEVEDDPQLEDAGNNGKAREKRSISDDAEDLYFVIKRFLGPALDVRYRKYGSPFYNIGGWAKSRSQLWKRYSPNWDRDKRFLGNALYPMRKPTYNRRPMHVTRPSKLYGENKKTYPFLSSFLEQPEIPQKRHLANPGRGGYDAGTFPATKFLASKYFGDSLVDEADTDRDDLDGNDISDSSKALVLRYFG